MIEEQNVTNTGMIHMEATTWLPKGEHNNDGPVFIHEHGRRQIDTVRN